MTKTAKISNQLKANQGRGKEEVKRRRGKRSERGGKGSERGGGGGGGRGINRSLHLLILKTFLFNCKTVKTDNPPYGFE